MEDKDAWKVKVIDLENSVGCFTNPQSTKQEDADGIC